MFRHFLAVIMLLLPLSLHGGETPLSASEPRPDTSNVLGVVPHGDGFYVLSRVYGRNSAHLLGTYIRANGEVDPRGRIVATDLEGWGFHTVTPEEGGRLLLTSGWWRADAADGKGAYELTRRTIDLGANQLVETKVSQEPTFPRIPWPRNARGETLQFTGGGVGQTVWFVGTDGVPRRPTPLTEIYDVAGIVPYGSDEWVIVGISANGYVWYRMSEATRALPQTQPLFISSQSSVRSAAVAGEAAVLYESIPQTSTNERHLTLRVFRPDGSWTTHTLLQTDIRQVTGSPETALVKDGNAWLVAHAWSSTVTKARELRMWRVTTSAVEMQLDSIPDARILVPRLVSGTARNLLLYERPFADDRPVFAHVWSRGTTIAPGEEPSPLTLRPPAQKTPHAVATPGGILTVWREGSSVGEVLMRVLGAGGTEPRRLSAPGADGRVPRVARNGDTYAVTWIERYARQERVLVRRFDANGNAFDAEPLVLDTRAIFPDTSFVAIGAENDGFRVAWHGRTADTSPSPKQTIYTTHIGARGRDFAAPEELTPPNVFSADPAIVSHGADSLLLYRQVSLVEPAGIYMRTYTGGIAPPRGPNRRLTDGATFAADAHDGELLIATARVVSKTEYCTDAQRFSLAGAMLAPAVTLGCTTTPYELPVPSPAVVADAGRWWVAPAEIHAIELRELRADGTPGETIRFFPAGMRTFDRSFFDTANGPAAVYTRDDATAEMAERAFLRTFPWPRRRAVRR